MQAIIWNYVRLGSCPFRIVPIRDLSIQDSAQSVMRPFGIASIPSIEFNLDSVNSDSYFSKS